MNSLCLSLRLFSFTYTQRLRNGQAGKLGKVITNTQEAACSFVHEVYRSK